MDIVWSTSAMMIVHTCWRHPLLSLVSRYDLYFFYHSDELQGNWLDTSDYVRPVNDGQFGICGAQNTTLNQCSLSKVQISDNARDKWSKYIQPVWSRIPRFGYCDKSKAWWSEPNEEYIQSESCTTAQNSDQAMTKIHVAAKWKNSSSKMALAYSLV